MALDTLWVRTTHALSRLLPGMVAQSKDTTLHPRLVEAMAKQAPLETLEGRRVLDLATLAGKSREEIEQIAREKNLFGDRDPWGFQGASTELTGNGSRRFATDSRSGNSNVGQLISRRGDSVHVVTEAPIADFRNIRQTTDLFDDGRVATQVRRVMR